MYHDEGLCLWVEFTLFDGFRPAGHNVTHVIIWDVGSAQGELGHNVSVVCDPFCGGRQGGGTGDGGVYCFNTHKQTVSNRLDYYGMTDMQRNACKKTVILTNIIITPHSSIHPHNKLV